MKIKFNFPPTVWPLLICSMYFFDRSWWTFLPFVDYRYPAAEAISMALGWADGRFPNGIESAGHGFYYYYLSNIGILFNKLATEFGLQIGLEFSILLVCHLFSATFSLLSIILVYEIANKIFGKTAAVFSSLLLALSPNFAVYSQSFLYHIHVQFFTSLAYYFVVSFLSEEDELQLPKRLIPMGLTSGLMVGVSPYAVIFCFLTGVAVILKLDRKKPVQKNILILLGSLFVGAFISTMKIRHPSWFLELVPIFLNVGSKTSGSVRAIYDSVAYMFPHAFGWGIMLYFLIGIFALAFNLKENPLHRFHFLAALFYIGPALLVGKNGIPRRLVLILPFVVVTAAYGTKFLIERLRRFHSSLAWLALSLLFGWQFINCWAWLRLKTQVFQLDAAMEWLNQNAVPDKKVKEEPLVLLHATDSISIEPYFYKNLAGQIPLRLIDWFRNDDHTSDLERFLRIPFDYALIDNLDSFGETTEFRFGRFRKALVDYVQSNKNLKLINVFGSDASLFGIRFRPPFNDPFLSIVRPSKTFLIKNMIAEQRVSIRESLKECPPAQQVMLMHTHSNFSSNGIFSLQETAEKLDRLGVKIWVPTDHFKREFSYRFLGFSKSSTQPSVTQRGIDLYFKELNTLEKTYANLTIIPGVEVIPYYYWTGSPLSRNLTIQDGSKHLLVFGMGNKEDYQNIPVASQDGSRPAIGEQPYQDCIDYVQRKKGLIFWSHPLSSDWSYPVPMEACNFQTSPYEKSLLATKNHNGFGVLNDGLELSRPGGLWDQALLEYCKGERGSVLTTIGESEFGRLGECSKHEDPYIFTVVQSKERGQRKILEALRKGYCYSIRSSLDGQFIWLNDFSVEAAPKHSVRLNLSDKAKGEKKIRVMIISNGKTIREFDHKGSLKLNDLIRPAAAGKRSYLRVIVTDEGRGLLITNPLIWENL